MRRLFAWIAGAAGGLAAWRLLARGRGGAVELPPAVEPGLDPRAEELRAKLAETEPPAAAPVESEAEAPPVEDPEERRRRVHEAGRAALDEMHGPLE
jgi:hypothetical protein